MTAASSPAPAVPAPRFLADRMLGKLARWLRILGYDTAYLPQLSPEGVMREGRRQRRLILTRDTRLLRRKDAPPFIFVQDDRCGIGQIETAHVYALHGNSVERIGQGRANVVWQATGFTAED